MLPPLRRARNRQLPGHSQVIVANMAAQPEGPTPLPRRHGGGDRRPPAPARASWMWAAAPVQRPGRSSRAPCGVLELVPPPVDVDEAFAEVWHRVLASPLSLSALAHPAVYSAMCSHPSDR